MRLHDRRPVLHVPLRLGRAGANMYFAAARWKRLDPFRSTPKPVRLNLSGSFGFASPSIAGWVEKRRPPEELKTEAQWQASFSVSHDR